MNNANNKKNKQRKAELCYTVFAWVAFAFYALTIVTSVYGAANNWGLKSIGQQYVQGYTESYIICFSTILGSIAAAIALFFKGKSGR